MALIDVYKQIASELQARQAAAPPERPNPVPPREGYDVTASAQAYAQSRVTGQAAGR